MGKEYFEVVKEFLDEDNNVTDFVVIEGGFSTSEEAWKFGEQYIEGCLDDEQITIYQSDEDGSVLDSWIVN